MDSQQETINSFLVQNFNYILRWEEQELGAAFVGRLTVNEYHVIEAVVVAEQQHHNTMGEVAARLSVTVGTLTTAVKTLCNKGFLVRQKGDGDKRIVWLHATTAALEADAYHANFHRRMVQGITDCLDHRQLSALCEALEVLGGWFTSLQTEPAYIVIPQIQPTKELE